MGGTPQKESSAGPQWWNCGHGRVCSLYAVGLACILKGSPPRPGGSSPTEGNQKLACIAAAAAGCHCHFRPAAAQSAISLAVHQSTKRTVYQPNPGCRRHSGSLQSYLDWTDVQLLYTLQQEGVAGGGKASELAAIRQQTPQVVPHTQ